MNNSYKYQTIKDAVLYSFEEYINNENLNSCQAAAKILEEDWREVNYSSFTKASYFLNIAIESFKLGEIADFIFEELSNIVFDYFENISNDQITQYKKDLAVFKNLKKDNNYKVITTSLSSKARVHYIINLKNN